MNITASQTQKNVLAFSPVVDIQTGDNGKLDVRATAERFVDANLRHIVNRRMKWSTVEQFVKTSLDALIDVTTIWSVNFEAMFDDTVALIRRATNRRWSWTSARPIIVTQVMRLFGEVQ